MGGYFDRGKQKPCKICVTLLTGRQIGMWIKLLMSRPSAMLVMLFHVSTASSFDGAVRPTLVDMWNYKHIRTKHPNRTTAKST